MQFLSLIALAGLASAAAIERSATPAAFAPTGQQHDLMKRNYTDEEIHANILNNHPAEWIVASADLYNYFVDNHGSNHTIYLSDEKKFVHMATVMPTIANSGKRQYSNPCFGYKNTYTTQKTSYGDEWKPASNCLYTGQSDAGGSKAISWSMTTTLTTTTSLDWSVITDVLSSSLSMSVSQSWSRTDTNTCNVLANSVVQVWESTYLAWGNFDSQNCQSCDYGSHCDGAYNEGTAAAPVNDRYNLGCSTGYDKTSC